MRKYISSSIKLILPVVMVAFVAGCATPVGVENQTQAKASNGKDIQVTISGSRDYCHASDTQAKCAAFQQEYQAAAALIDAGPGTPADKTLAKASLASTIGMKYAKVEAIYDVRLCGIVGETRVCEALKPPTTDQNADEFKKWLVDAINDFAEKIAYYPARSDPNTFDPNIPIENMIIQNIQNTLPMNGTCTLTYNHVTHGYDCL